MALQELLSNWALDEQTLTMATDPIRLTKIRDLTLASSEAGRPAHVSAASGLVRVADRLYVIADDELHLGMFCVSTNTPGELVRILPGELPLPKAERKRSKPDFESLVRVPSLPSLPHGALLALGSGSRPARERGVLIPLGADGQLRADALQILDLGFLFSATAHAVGKVNVEGAVIAGDRLLLFQRGNKGDGINAIVDVSLAAVLDRSAQGDASLHTQARRYDLGSIRGIPLGFSDATLLNDGSILFAAIAEDTDDAYADGPCAGAAIGIIGRDGVLRRLSAVAGGAKIEGIHAEQRDNVVELLLVTDADDPSIPAVLYGATLQLE